MDYRDYKGLMERYNELAVVSVSPEETKESLTQKLIGNSYEKKKIYTAANDLIDEYVVRYENDPSLLNEEAVSLLRDFLVDLMPEKGPIDYFDPGISLRVSRLLLAYYQASQELDQIVQAIYWCMKFDLMLMDHRNASESCPYTLLAEQYLKDFDKLTDQNKHLLVKCWLLCVYNQRDLTFGLRKYRDIKRQFEAIRQKMGEDFELMNYIGCETYVLYFAMMAWYKACAPNADGSFAGMLKDLEDNRDLIAEVADDLRAVLESEQVCSLVADRMTTAYYVDQADYYLGRITIEEMLARTEELTRPREDHNVLEQCTSLLSMNTSYLDNLCRCPGLDRTLAQKKTLEIVAYVRQRMMDVIKGLGVVSQYASIYQGNLFMLELMSAASNIVDFDYFKSIVLDITIRANKELYVHTMMVREICLVLLESILDRAPEYMDGVAGQSWTHWREHRAEALTLMENSALFHDIGKYYCLDFVTNASRRLSDDEFEVIKEHPLNFSTIYQGQLTPEVRCIRDCAELHHLWYDESSGYPRKKHTTNKPFVNILTIADCIDAATDYIGRPYGMGKTLKQLIGEFDEGRNTRYCGFISELLHLEEIQNKIEYVISERRKEIYCNIYLQGQ